MGKWITYRTLGGKRRAVYLWTDNGELRHGLVFRNTLDCIRRDSVPSFVGSRYKARRGLSYNKMIGWRKCCADLKTCDLDSSTILSYYGPRPWRLFEPRYRLKRVRHG